MLNQDGKTLIKILLGMLIVISIMSYGVYQARNLINGPQVALASPINGETVTDPIIKVNGSAKNISYISLNNRQIFVDNKGTFSEELLLSPGYNVWTLEAKDKFGRSTSKKIEIVFNKN